MYKLKVIIFFCLISEFLSAQKDYPKDYFRSPIDGEILLSGNFGETRPNHFHSGLDIKTGGKEGMKIYSVADGYVSRIKVSAGGYGKAIYITHPNGYTSVYAHMKSFSDSISKYVKDYQYQREKFEIELFPDPHRLIVTKGGVIGLSGNTGSSQGPHLHFEIRNAFTEYPINPLLFGFKVKDTIKPIITSVTVYPLSDKSKVNGKNASKKINLVFSKGKYSVKPADVITVSGDIGFGIECYDRETQSTNKNAAYSIELFKDGEKKYSHTMETFGFEETRYVNCHIDYPQKIKTGKAIQRSFLVENNKLSIYKGVDDEGEIEFDSEGEHLIKYVVKDIYGNKDSVELKVKSIKSGTNIEFKKSIPAGFVEKYFECDKSNEFITEDITAKFKENTFYEDFNFSYLKSDDTIPGAFAPLHYVHSNEVPLHHIYKLSIKSASLTSSLQNKALIVSVYGKNSKISEGGEWKEGFVTTQTRNFGKFTIVIDTTPPAIKPLNIIKGQLKAGAKNIQIRIGDNLSGIKTYRGTVDEKWILMEYEPKQRLLFYSFDDTLTKGKHLFELEVKDERGNSSFYKTEFVK